MRTLLGETIDSKPSIHNKVRLDSIEEQWLKEIILHYQQCSNNLITQKESWEIRLEEKDFIKWRSKLEKHCLFFNGASKVNPRMAGGGGIIICPEGRT